MQRTRFALMGLSILVLVSGVAWSTDAKIHYYRDDPIWHDGDRMDTPPPVPRHRGQVFDFLDSVFSHGRPAHIPPAGDINTVGGVPDSEWFTNRIGRRTSYLGEWTNGAAKGPGPDMIHPWTVLRIKAEGVTPGFTIRDARGDVYYIKVDPPGYPHLSTSAEAISSRLFYAIGYNVPAVYLVDLDPDNLVIDPGAKVIRRGHRRSLKRSDLEALFEDLPRSPDGKVRVLASLQLPGKPLGPFLYTGTRSDDPNDLVPHEDRRVLRALKVFAAWVNHYDLRSINTLDMYVREGSRHVIRHYLLDFGATLGSASVRPQNGREGHESFLEFGPMFHSLFTLGLWDRSWRSQSAHPRYRQLGPFTSEGFQPEQWRPNYRNAAVQRARPDDNLWAVRILLRFDGLILWSIVHEGRLENPEEERYLTEMLIRRRDKLVRTYLRKINPIGDFVVSYSDDTSRYGPDGYKLFFTNPAVSTGMIASAEYRYKWYRFDNDTGKTTDLGIEGTVSNPWIPMPKAASSEFLGVRIRTYKAGFPAWQAPVDVVIDRYTSLKVVGVQRTLP